jgi:hypothetical protein
LKEKIIKGIEKTKGMKETKKNLIEPKHLIKLNKLK